MVQSKERKKRDALMSDSSGDVHIQPPRKRSPLLIAGGIGCLVMIGLLIGGCGLLFYLGQDLSKEFSNVEAELMTSSAVEEELGSPITVTPSVSLKMVQIDGVNHTTYSGKVSGPKGEGSYQAKFISKGMEFDLQSITVDVNGKQIDVSEEEELDLGIELGE